MHIRKSHVCANKLDVQKKTSVSHSSTEDEIISLIPALDLWDSVIEIYHSSSNKTNKNQRCKRAMGKLVGKHSTKHGKTNPYKAHQSRSDQH